MVQPRLVAAVRRLALRTSAPIEFVDITAQVATAVRDGGVREGVASVCSQHTTAAVRVQEAEPLLLQDLRQFLERQAPATDPYRHNDFRIRTVNMHPDERANGHSHCLQLLLGSSESIAISAGRLQLGKWQRVFLVELDGPRAHREVLVQIVGLADGRSDPRRIRATRTHPGPTA